MCYQVAVGDKIGKVPPPGLACKAYLLLIPFLRFFKLLRVVLGTQTLFLELVKAALGPPFKFYYN